MKTSKKKQGIAFNRPVMPCFDFKNKQFKEWMDKSYKRKAGEDKAGYYEYEGDFLTKEEMYGQWLRQNKA